MSLLASSIFLFLFIGLVLAILGTFAWGGLSAAPWVPLWKKDIRRMLTVAQVKPGETVYDLGAGDGRIIQIAAEEFHANAIGYEVAILPFVWGYIKIQLRGLSRIAKLKYSNFYRANLKDADVICTFLTPAAMQKLKPKLLAEIKPTCRVVSYAFSIPEWQPLLVDKPNETTAAVYLYQRS